MAGSLLLSSLLLATDANATNGYFQPGYGTRTKALAGAGVAGAGDAMTIALNPAGLTLVGDSMDAGISLFSPRRSYEATGGTPAAFLATGRVDSGREAFPIPYAGISYKIDDDSAWGIALYGNGGMNTSYPAVSRQCYDPGSMSMVPGAGIFCAGEAGVDLTQLFIAPAYARNLTDKLSIGISPIFSVQWFSAKGVQSFAMLSGDPAHLSNNGKNYSFGAGLRIGVQYEVSDGLRIGVAAVSPIYMTRFKDYAGLFAEHGKFNIPPAVTVGAAINLDDTKTLFVDYQHIWYDSVRSVGNPFASPGPLGADNGPGFGWQDIGTIRIGFLWQASDKWSFRAGYAYNDQPIPESEVLFNVLAPGVVQHHITGGISRRISEKTQLHFAALYAPEAGVTAPNPFDASQTIRIQMHQYEATIGISHDF